MSGQVSMINVKLLILTLLILFHLLMIMLNSVGSFDGGNCFANGVGCVCCGYFDLQYMLLLVLKELMLV